MQHKELNTDSRESPEADSGALRSSLVRLLSAQSPLGHALYVHYGLNPQELA